MRAGTFKATPQLRIERVRRGLTQEELADKAGVDRGHVSYIERGKRSMMPATASKLVRALGFSFSRALEEHLIELDMTALSEGGHP